MFAGIIFGIFFIVVIACLLADGNTDVMKGKDDDPPHPGFMDDFWD